MNMQIDYIRATWYVAPYIGLVIASIWLLRHTPKGLGWLMVVGSALRFCDIFVKNFVMNLWPMPSTLQSPEDYRAFQFHQQVQSIFEMLGSLGMLLFVIGFLLYARKLRTEGSRVA
jgi:hypothetical protein